MYTVVVERFPQYFRRHLLQQCRNNKRIKPVTKGLILATQMPFHIVHHEAAITKLSSVVNGNHLSKENNIILFDLSYNQFQIKPYIIISLSKAQ